MRIFTRLTLALIPLAACIVFVSAEAKAQTTARPTAAEVEARNKKNEADNATVARTFTAGNEALTAKQFDQAIGFYREGLQTREEPALLSNLSEALRRRGVNHWNDALKAVDPQAKARSTNLARQNWLEAAEKAQRALQIIREREAAPLQQQPIGLQARITATGARAQAMRLVASKVDQSQAKAAWDAFSEYIAVVDDPWRKSKLKGEELQMLFDAKAYDLAIVRSRAVLKEEPEHLDALRVLGQALISSGDKDEFEEALTYLQRYLDQAPDTDPSKEPVREAVERMKKQ